MSFPAPSADERISAQAADWLARRDDQLTPDEAEAFARWRAADPRHEAAVQRLETTWTLLQQLQTYRPTARTHPDCDLLAPPRAARMPWSTLLAAAAVFAVLLGGLLYWTQSKPSAAAAPAVYATTPGGYQRLSLPDGSVVELNADTEVRVRYTHEERRLLLRRGQAHFIVAKDAQRPFHVDVEARGVGVRAVGTAFDVQVGTNDVRVLVTAGTIRVERDGQLSIDAPLVHAGWRALVPALAAVEPTIEAVPAEAMRQALAWHSPRLAFVDTPLGEVVSQFNRRNTVQLALVDAELAAMPVGGSFDADNVEAFVRLLAGNGDIVVERPDQDRILLRKASRH